MYKVSLLENYSAFKLWDWSLCWVNFDNIGTQLQIICVSIFFQIFGDFDHTQTQILIIIEITYSVLFETILKVSFVTWIEKENSVEPKQGASL